MSDKINIPAITKPIDLTEYDPGLRRDDGSPVIIDVWLNPSRAHQNKLSEIGTRAQIGQARLERLRNGFAEGGVEAEEFDTQIKAFSDTSDKITEEMFGWYAETWSRNDEAWSVDEVRALAEQDPLLWEWLTAQTQRLIGEFRESRRKK
jgi:hypothetical protein